MPARTTLENRYFDLFQQYFHQAEKYRRWNVMEDIPWDQTRKDPDPALAQLIESFYAVEMYLPDYVRHIMGMVRKSRGRAWFIANWGYEECKHSMVLERWLVQSGARTEEQMQDWEGKLLDETWLLHYGDEQLLSLCYTTLQEYATGMTYRRLQQYAKDKGLSDPALHRVLSLLNRDEYAHFGFFKNALKIYMDYDRDGALEALTHVLQSFHMPAADIIPDWKSRNALILEQQIMTDRVFMKDVVKPVLRALEIDHQEMRAVRKRLAEHAARGASADVTETVETGTVGRAQAA